jgi:hypothetical protein
MAGFGDRVFEGPPDGEAVGRSPPAPRRLEVRMPRRFISRTPPRIARALRRTPHSKTYSHGFSFISGEGRQSKLKVLCYRLMAPESTSHRSQQITRAFYRANAPSEVAATRYLQVPCHRGSGFPPPSEQRVSICQQIVRRSLKPEMPDPGRFVQGHFPVSSDGQDPSGQRNGAARTAIPDSSGRPGGVKVKHWL